MIFEPHNHAIPGNLLSRSHRSVGRTEDEQAESEQVLREIETRFHAFINTGFFFAWITDGEGVVEYLNEPSCAIMERTLEECVGKSLFDLFPTEVAQVMLDNIRQVVRTGTMLETVETVLLPDGKVHHFLIHRFLMEQQSGRRLVGGSAIDITARKEAEQVLQTNETRRREAQRAARIGSWERDFMTNRILWSYEMFNQFQFDPADDVPSNERILERIHPDDRLMYQHILETPAESGKPYAFDMRLLFEDGTQTWKHAVGNVKCDETGRIVRQYGTFMDITIQKQAELALRQSQESLNHAQKITHVGSWQHDALKGTMVWSEELFRICGLEPGTIVPSVESLFTYIHPLDQQRVQERMQQAMREGTEVDDEVRLVGANSVLRYIHLRAKLLTDMAGRSIGSHGTLADITERVKAQQEQTKFVSLIENSRDFIAMTSLNGVLLTMNAAGRNLIGLGCLEDVTSTRLSDLMPLEVWEWMQQGVLPIVLRDGSWEGECQLVNAATDKVYEMQASFFLIHNPTSGEPMCLATVQRDISEQKWTDAQLQQNLMTMQEQNIKLEWHQQKLESANAQLEAANAMLVSLATTDGLTGAKNHRAFQEKLSEEFARAKRTYCSLSLILLDVDKFKSYNDTYGHPEGDRILQQVVSVLVKIARKTDFVARYGGEEFIILLPETDGKSAMQAAERFRAALEAKKWPLRLVTASFGVASLHADTVTAQQLVDMADKALYASKGSGRNCVTHADAIS